MSEDKVIPVNWETLVDFKLTARKYGQPIRLPAPVPLRIVLAVLYGNVGVIVE